eukprot:TRINITY_DN945_c0_g1_i1.p1 TRINITY_DN945_c0_g1~~TRINITY_DN945_c0_g1_i1.p1  ORF type:complete len:479 (-),score=82.89 TRINITY_DN945_c0_g1_i1:145-1581(-)
MSQPQQMIRSFLLGSDPQIDLIKLNQVVPSGQPALRVILDHTVSILGEDFNSSVETQTQTLLSQLVQGGDEMMPVRIFSLMCSMISPTNSNILLKQLQFLANTFSVCSTRFLRLEDKFFIDIRPEKPSLDRNHFECFDISSGRFFRARFTPNLQKNDFFCFAQKNQHHNILRAVGQIEYKGPTNPGFFHLFERGKRLSECDTKNVGPTFIPTLFLSALTGLHFLVSNGYPAVSLSLRNIIVTEENWIKLYDLPINTRSIDDETEQYYIAPELDLESCVPLKIDVKASSPVIWSLGLILYQFIYQKPAYSGSRKGIQNISFLESPYSEFVEKTLKGMLKVSPKERSSWEELLSLILSQTAASVSQVTSNSTASKSAPISSSLTPEPVNTYQREDSSSSSSSSQASTFSANASRPTGSSQTLDHNEQALQSLEKNIEVLQKRIQQLEKRNQELQERESRNEETIKSLTQEIRIIHWYLMK